MKEIKYNRKELKGFFMLKEINRGQFLEILFFLFLIEKDQKMRENDAIGDIIMQFMMKRQILRQDTLRKTNIVTRYIEKGSIMNEWNWR